MITLHLNYKPQRQLFLRKYLVTLSNYHRRYPRRFMFTREDDRCYYLYIYLPPV